MMTIVMRAGQFRSDVPFRVRSFSDVLVVVRVDPDLLSGESSCERIDAHPSLSLSSLRSLCGSVESAERGPVPETAAADTAEGQLSSRAEREVGLPALERGRRPDGKWA